jgi:hypothetical protein
MRVKVLLLALALAFAAPAFAGSINIDFGQTLAGGYIGFSSGNAIGSNIQVGTMTITDDPGFNGTYAVTGACSGGCLQFSTVADTISLTGTVDGITGTLFSGTLTSFTVDSGKGLVVWSGIVSTDVDLLAALGVGADYNLATDLFGSSTANPLGEAVSTDFDYDTPTPEPMSMLLLGSFLSLAGTLLAKKKRG